RDLRTHIQKLPADIGSNKVAAYRGARPGIHILEDEGIAYASPAAATHAPSASGLPEGQDTRGSRANERSDNSYRGNQQYQAY
ncbi:hypothetical protein ABTE58_19045, partial [Acinetobacter baumannii]